jgi:hypothetical protein
MDRFRKRFESDGEDRVDFGEFDELPYTTHSPGTRIQKSKAKSS